MPKEVDNYDKTRGYQENDSIRRFFQEQIVGLFGPTVHMMKIMRRLAHVVGTGAWDPRVWPYYQKLHSDLWEDWMRVADQLLDDEQLLTIVYEALAQRRPQSRTRGRLGTPAEVVLRLLLLKHIRNWNYEVVGREVRANLVYRAFTRVGGGKFPDDTGEPSSLWWSASCDIQYSYLRRSQVMGTFLAIPQLFFRTGNYLLCKGRACETLRCFLLFSTIFQMLQDRSMAGMPSLMPKMGSISN